MNLSISLSLHRFFSQIRLYFHISYFRFPPSVSFLFFVSQTAKSYIYSPLRSFLILSIHYYHLDAFPLFDSFPACFVSLPFIPRIPNNYTLSFHNLAFRSIFVSLLFPNSLLPRFPLIHSLLPVSFPLSQADVTSNSCQLYMVLLILSFLPMLFSLLLPNSLLHRFVLFYSFLFVSFLSHKDAA